MRRLWLAANVLMLLMFAFSLVVQVNDPDPLVWMSIYGLAAVACGLELGGRGRAVLPALVGGLAVAWSVTIAPHVFGKVPFLEMFSAWEMQDVGVEESREMYGLLIVAGWMAVLTVSAARRRRAETSRPHNGDEPKDISSPP